MLRAAIFLGALGGASAGAVSLDTASFKTEITDTGKAAFVKFLAPW